jgi:hypothetical protein
VEGGVGGGGECGEEGVMEGFLIGIGKALYKNR